MTFSIIAKDEKTDQLGVAVQTHWFAVGALCPWIEAGVGAVATQSMVETSYGPKGLELMRAGKPAREALDLLLAQDEDREHRQVAIIDMQGRCAVFTGGLCIQAAGHIVGSGYSVQANMMKNDSVWPAMANAFQTETGDLADRLLAALIAAQTAGGDIRGKQSAAMLVADGAKTNDPWEHVTVNLRVDDHPEPLAELKRLLDINIAYTAMNEGDRLLVKNDFETAKEKYSLASRLAPEIEELPFWQAVTLAETGRVAEALPIFKSVFQKNADWAELVKRLPASGSLKNKAEIITQILALLDD